MIEGIPPAAYELGDPLAEYKTKRFNTLGGPIMAAVGLLFLVLGCQFSQSLVLLGILGMILLPFGLFITLFGLKQRGLRVVLFRDGFMYQQPKATQIVRWQDIAFVHKTVTRNSINLIYMGKTFTYTIPLVYSMQRCFQNQDSAAQDVLRAFASSREIGLP